jgi:predicted protein tyrosine phosphatase
MPHIKVCSLSRLQRTVAEENASHILTLINEGTPVRRPDAVPADRHLFIGMSDIVEPQDGHILPGEAHVRRLLAFVRGWSRERPMVVHCYAGVSRSTAAALIAAAALNPARPEAEIAAVIRARSPTATPNLKLVGVADTILGRNGRLFDAAESIGRGEDCFEGVPFRLEL